MTLPSPDRDVKDEIKISDDDVNEAWMVYADVVLGEGPGSGLVAMRAAIVALTKRGWQKVEPDQFVGRWRKEQPRPFIIDEQTP